MGDCFGNDNVPESFLVVLEFCRTVGLKLVLRIADLDVFGPDAETAERDEQK